MASCLTNVRTAVVLRKIVRYRGIKEGGGGGSSTYKIVAPKAMHLSRPNSHF